MQSNNEMLESSQPKPKRIKQLPPPRVQRSRSCSSLCKRQPQQPISSATLKIYSPTKSVIAESNDQTLSPQKTILNGTVIEQLAETANDSLSDQLDNIFNDSINLIDEPDLNPMMKFIKDIMETYQQSIEKLANETAQMRAELNDQKQQIISKLKLVKQQQTKQNTEFEIKLRDQKQFFQKQQQQLKQHMNQQLQLQQAKTLLPNCIQYETISNPIKQKTSSPKLAPKMPSKTKSNINEQAYHQNKKSDVPLVGTKHASAGSSKALLKPTLFPPPRETLNKERKPRKIDAMFLGSSIVKHVHGRKIKQNSGRYAKICSFPGGAAHL